jgi:hypothetical protein
MQLILSQINGYTLIHFDSNFCTSRTYSAILSYKTVDSYLHS